FRPIVIVGGYRFTMHGTPSLRARRPVVLSLAVDGPDRKPARLGRLSGEPASALFFRAGTLDYFPAEVRSLGPGRLAVDATAPRPGTWRLFLEVKAKHDVITAPF